ncbi:hypothetical protein DX933_12320 [Ornithinibacillus gellani]|uniref:metallophosphoesterase n=1 Tax=Ornithinibacillus gellani TaxID=2293253 RepID=UPI000F475A0F|nr:metallophosphoesterase [Ornithinibacillus gellani]TQS74108.1 hypothetical protein DX933_12320 [Ornithinibacillus gellani]
MLKNLKQIRLGVLIATALVCGLILWENNRIHIEKEIIYIADLPEDLEGFTILQITDLHEKRFGKQQQRLLKKINAVAYDVVVITGDMLHRPDSTHTAPFYELLEGLSRETPILFVKGNADPFSYAIEPAFGKSDFIKEIEKRGATLLESYYTMEREQSAVQFVYFDFAVAADPEVIGRVNGTFHSQHAEQPDYREYQKQLWDAMQAAAIFDKENQVVVALNHFPIVDARVDYIKEDPLTEWHHYDLIIAGHYHGGQIRIPFYGAMYIPEPWYEPNSMFPPQNRVQGLWEYEGNKQYVSAGLGSSDAIAAVKLRLFNPPEINVLQLKRK